MGMQMHCVTKMPGTEMLPLYHGYHRFPEERRFIDILMSRYIP